MRLGLAVVLAAAPAIASAQCTQPYSRAEMGAHLGDVDDALREADLNGAKRTMQQIGERLPCMREVADRGLLARFGRHMARTHFFEQDEENAIRWGLFSRYADPDLDWEETPDHPFRELVETAEDMPIGAVPNRALSQPRGGGVFVNGSLVLEPRARAEVPSLVQIFDGNALFSQAYWQDGSAFPEWMLKSGTGAVRPPKWWDGPVPETTTSKRTAATLPVTPLVVGGSMVAASGLTYLLATATASSLKNKTTPTALTTTRSATNALVIGSGAVFLGGVGVGVGGVLLDGTGLRLSGTF